LKYRDFSNLKFKISQLAALPRWVLPRSSGAKLSFGIPTVCGLI